MEALPLGDYVSPGLEAIQLDSCFPNMICGDKQGHPWVYLRREIPHNWYADARKPLMGFLNRDEATLLYGIAKTLSGARALEIGCWFGWSTCHLALAGLRLDVVDPVLADPLHRQSIEQSLTCCGVLENVKLHAIPSPQALGDIYRAHSDGWSLFFIDGDHESHAPEKDVEACLSCAAPDAVFVFHDLASPEVAAGLRILEARGFHVLIYQTMQIMGVAWRGKWSPVHHVPDPKVPWQLPHHLVGFPVSGVEFCAYPISLRTRLVEQDQQLRAMTTQIQQQKDMIWDLQKPGLFKKISNRVTSLMSRSR